MMKLKSLFFAMAFVMAVALTGCSAGRDDNSAAPVNPTNSVSVDNNAGSSAGMDDNAQGSAGLASANPSGGADGVQGGGTAGNNYYNDSVTGNGSHPPKSSGAMDDIGNAAGDAARSVGDAIGNAANGVGRAMR